MCINELPIFLFLISLYQMLPRGLLFFLFLLLFVCVKLSLSFTQAK